MPRRRKTDGHKEIEPTLNRFAEDTSMLGFRYLHTRYKTWFRLIWALLLTFFVGLTFYQVFERITYYFIRNPLTTRRSYDSPQNMRFPTIGICNKMQLKASAFAAREPELLRYLSLLYEDEGQITENRTLLEELSMFDHVDTLAMYKAAHQKVEDLFLSCEIGKKGSCLDEIEPFLTEYGVCFVVAPNITVRRPGPETTLSLVLNLEPYDIIPGTVADSGIILSLHDADVESTPHHSVGVHLEAGKVVTIPINEVRRFLSSKKLFETSILLDTDSTIECPENCEDVSFSSVVFGGRLNPSDVSPFLPVDWEDIKESKVLAFQRALDIIPRHRVPVIVEVQALAEKAQEFAKMAEQQCVELLQIFSVYPNAATVPCIAPKGAKELERALVHFQAREPMWERITTYLVRSLAKELNSTAAALGILLKDDGSANNMEKFVVNESMIEFSMLQLGFLGNKTGNSFGLRTMDLDTRDKLLEFGRGLPNGREVLISRNFVSKSSTFKAKLLHLSTPFFCIPLLWASIIVSPFVRDLRTCMKKISDNSERASEIVEDCRRVFKEYYDVLLDTRRVYTLADLSTNVVADYIINMGKITASLRSFMFVNRVHVLDYHDCEVDLKEFESLYREGGADTYEIHELMKLRKLMLRDILYYIDELKLFYEKGLQARRNVLRRFGVVIEKHQGLTAIEETVTCLRNISENIPLLKKSKFVRGEWLSRIQRQVEIAQSYSATPQYDQVNLLQVKIYFAHFKQERIIQERSYNVFLLLAEIGGTIGLYVGATLLTVAETIVFFFEERTRRILVKPAYL
ncbi:unnamed protein product [Cylicocyclus nassatus]|uniref:Uncharacterized protein n=1 Tax=Cylicocyclus nassatus TaxID=53992 RepID=A0AA36DP82_CYLNA|nr:unnamed protein product [Cylicocyclus nassatus]